MVGNARYAGLTDVRDAAANLRPIYERTGGGDGFVSRRLSLPNVLSMVPATRAGAGAIEESTAAAQER